MVENHVYFVYLFQGFQAIGNRLAAGKNLKGESELFIHMDVMTMTDNIESGGLT